MAASSPPGTDARRFAVRAHGDQRYGDRPYFEHLDAVVELLQRHGHPEAIEVGFLHDAIEDTDVSFEMLRDEFGDAVARAVAFCSDEAGPDRKSRKRATYARMRRDVVARHDWLQLAVPAKVADRLANVQACRRNNPELLAVYAAEHATFREALYVDGLCDSLWLELDALLTGPAG